MNGKAGGSILAWEHVAGEFLPRHQIGFPVQLRSLVAEEHQSLLFIPLTLSVLFGDEDSISIKVKP